MDRAAGASVEADRLHDRERRGPGEDVDVGAAQHAGVFRDDGGGRVLGDRVEVGADRGPHVLSVVLEDRSRVDRGQRLAGAGFDVGDVLLVHRDVLAGGHPAQVPADEVRPRVVQRDGRGAGVPDDVVAEVEVVDGYPAGVDHVNEHQGVVVREVDVDVVRGVVGAVPGQFDPLAADFQGVAVGEGHVWDGAGGVTVAQQQSPGLVVADADDIPAEQRGRSLVVCVVVRVDHVGDLVGQAVCGGDLVHGTPDVVADVRGCVKNHDAVRGGQERRHVDVVGDRVEVPLDLPDVVPVLVQGRPLRNRRDGRIP